MTLRPALLATAACLALPTAAIAQDAPIILPGAPGQDSSTLTAESATQVAASRYTPADIEFMQAMIPHHFQATQMADLVAERTNTEELTAIAKKIGAGQADEITFMQGWLRDRGETPADPGKHAAMGHSTHDVSKMHAGMAGMATPEQMAQLAAAEGTAFDRLFLQLMIAHHQGALEMVDTLFETQGAAYDPVLYRFVSDIDADQKSEITRMSALLEKLAEDPRTTLAAGFRDAGMAMKGLTLVGSLPKPAGFFDPENPAGLRLAVADANPARPDTGAEDSDTDNADVVIPEEPDTEAGDPKTKLSERSPLFSFAQTDLAFSGDMVVVGNYHGFNIYRIADDAMPALVSSTVCPGGQGDVSIVGTLLIMSVEQTRGRVDCGLQGVAEDISEERFRGLRIFDISDATRPRQVGQVQTCRGSHTHSVVAEDNASILVYNSGTARVRDEAELDGCTEFGNSERGSALFSIDVIEIPKANPAASRIVDSPRVFADGDRIAGLWAGGDHGDGTQDTRRTDQCHDITIFPTKGLAAGACSGNGIVLDISDPRKPVRVDAVTDTGFAYWHSATFNNDGTKVVFTDEWGGGGRPRCRTYDPMTWGANALYDLADGKLTPRSLYKMPAAQGEMENCVAHNGSLVPVPGRDIFVQAWYQGGISLMDFTDTANPVEIAYFDRGPIDADQMVLGGFWSVYWYDGRIYGTEIARGLDVLELEPSEYLSANEIAAAKEAMLDPAQNGTFNPQQQYPVRWPDSPAVARAYLDQMQRMEPQPEAMLAPYLAALDAAEAGDAGAASALDRLADDLSEAPGVNVKLAETMRGIAEGLRKGG